MTPTTDGATWAVANLVLTGITSVTGLGMLWTFLKKKKEEEEAEEAKRAVQSAEEDNSRRKSKLLGLLPAAASIILFILTEDMSADPTLFDKWTLLTAVFTLGNFGLAFLTRNKEAEEKKA